VKNCFNYSTREFKGEDVGVRVWVRVEGNDERATSKVRVRMGGSIVTWFR
jgi:hypothetical protein